ncbi:MAG: tetratricopeptide repeat protein [Vulcanimicrobiota bacterium]
MEKCRFLIILLTLSIIFFASETTISFSENQDDAVRLLEEGESLYRSGNAAEALKKFETGLQICEKLHSKEGMCTFLYNLANLYCRLGNYKKALEYSEKAYIKNKEIGNEQYELWILMIAGMASEGIGNYQNALDYSEQALRSNRKTGDKNIEMNLFLNIGGIYYKLGDYAKAEEFTLKSLTLSKEIGDESNEGDCLNNLGNIYLTYGDYYNAIKYLQQAIELKQNIGEMNDVGESLTNIGSIYNRIGNHQKAIDYYMKASKIFYAKNNRKGIQATLNNVGNVYIKLGDYNSALECLKSSLKITQENGDLPGEGQVLSNIGLIYMKFREYDIANKHFQEALKISQKIHAHDLNITSLINMGRIYYGTNDNNKSMNCLKQALDLNNDINDYELKFKILIGMGLTSEKMKLDEKAIDYYIKAIDVLESVRGKLKIEDYKISFFQDRVDIYGVLVDLLLINNKYKDAWNYIERSKARTLLDIVGNRKIHFREKSSPEIIKKEVDIDNKISSLRSIMEKEKDTGRQKVFFNQIEDLQKEYEEVIEKVKISNPEYTSLRSVQITSLEEIQNLIEKDSLLIEYFIGKEKSYLFIIDKSNLIVIKISQNEEQLGEKISALQERIITQSPCDVQIKSLSEVLLPSEARVAMKGKKRLIIIPHSLLHHLSFSMLVDENGDYLVKNYQILTEPSASVWKLCLDKKRNKNEAIAAYALGDLQVVFQDEYKEDDIRKKKQSGDLAVRGTIVMSPDLVRVGLPPLPASKEEVDSIGALYPGGTILVGKEMTSEKVRDTIKGKSIVHFATHGVLDPLHPLFSGLVLSDKILTTTDIFSLDMDANLVVLSACNTAGGKLYSGDDIIGLSRAFMYIGSPVIVASLWRVSDVSTAELMKNFYQELKTGKSEGQAMREAQLKTMENYSHPYYWAPFVVIGESRKK